MDKYDDSDKRNYEPVEKAGSKANTTMRAIFGIIMIVIYVGMGVLLLINFFNWAPDYDIARYIVGPVLIIYGIWRAYRQVKGID